MWAWAIPAVLSLLGNFLHGRGQRQAQQKAWEANRPEWERSERSKAARAQLVRRMLAGLGIEGAIDPALMEQLGTPGQFPQAPTSSFMGDLGGGMAGIAPYVYQGMSAGGGPGLTPASDAAAQGQLYGPPALGPGTAVNPEFIQPPDESALTEEYLRNWGA